MNNDIKNNINVHLKSILKQNNIEPNKELLNSLSDFSININKEIKKLEAQSDYIDKVSTNIDDTFKNLINPNYGKNFNYFDFKIPNNELSLIIAHTGHGKTRIAIDIASKMHQKDYKVAFITCEMSSSDILHMALLRGNEKYISKQNKIELKKLYNQNNNIFSIYDTNQEPNFFQSNLISLVYSLIKKGYNSIFLDYFQLIDKESSDIKEQLRLYLKNTAKELQKIAKENNITIITTVQTNKINTYKELIENNVSESIDISRGAGYMLGIFKWNKNILTAKDNYYKKEYEAINDFITQKEEYNECNETFKNTEFIYIKEIKTRNEPIKPNFRLGLFNYGLCKLVSTIEVDYNKDDNTYYEKSSTQI